MIRIIIYRFTMLNKYIYIFHTYRKRGLKIVVILTQHPKKQLVMFLVRL